MNAEEELAASKEPMRFVLRSFPTVADSKGAFRITNGRPKLALVSDAEAIWMFDPQSDVVKASGWLAQVTATPANGDPLSRWSSMKVPVLVLGIPSVQRLAIGCIDLPANLVRHVGRYRFTWRGEVQREDKAPAYWVTGSEWRALVVKFGLLPQMDDTDVKRVKAYPWRSPSGGPQA
jgi:hypothetical protein